jgi:hypothetical protein
MEASPSPVYGARLLSGFGLIPIASSNLAASANVKAPQPWVVGLSCPQAGGPLAAGKGVASSPTPEHRREHVQPIFEEAANPREPTSQGRPHSQPATRPRVVRRGWLIGECGYDERPLEPRAEQPICAERRLLEAEARFESVELGQQGRRQGVAELVEPLLDLGELGRPLLRGDV